MKNDVDTIIKDLKRENAELRTILERLKWRNRNQKQEIRRLNTAHIVKNNIIDSREAKILHLSGISSDIPMNFDQLKEVIDTPVGGCCGGGCHSGE